MKKEIKEKVMKIMDLALEINSREKNTIFVEFSGHTNEICVHTYERGWEHWRETGEGRKKLNESYLYLDKDDCVEKLDNLIEKLKEMKG
ncbi:hypothetical protein [Leptotrichia sp. oral taxon 847]|uniref:hypothetical protein n=1 Tax=Leptotrichia sp. oral taxon 847 TaxID=1785996 RepID=UPI000768269C|nr:hypothetical protein [Leptotrichia sp. oral taxon 847]AMD95615.1 hypothetical protein AXF11_08540 [Leptotrichia sp. oral taxon 847]